MKYLALLVLIITTQAYANLPNWQASFKDKIVSDEMKSNIATALPKASIVPITKKHKVLIFSGSAGYRHKSIPVGKYALEQLGLSSGTYQSIVSHDPKYFEPEMLKTFDAVIMLNSTGNFFMPTDFKKLSYRKDFSDQEWSALRKRHDQLVTNLLNYVENGGGLVGIHAATDACYDNHSYGDALGGYLLYHPWMSNNTVTINVEDQEHAVNAAVFKGIKSFSLKDEIYQFRDKPYSREKLRILLHLDPERSDKPKKIDKRADNDYAVAWVKALGKGRVFYSSLGHNDDIYWNPVILRHYLAGIQFALGDLKADTTPSAKLPKPVKAKKKGKKTKAN